MVTNENLKLSVDLIGLNNAAMQYHIRPMPSNLGCTILFVTVCTGMSFTYVYSTAKLVMV